ncbi:Calcium-transporting ATPase [Propionicimonas sp. T2.31MG-18]|uniref:cation-translocating P-type ATPase n=1 Tax=Propionicimonas sp. T2.31MG-18 TaxID=3157620 RepID=UPI0035E7AE51
MAGPAGEAYREAGLVWHTADVEAVLAAVRSAPSGLTTHEAMTRLESLGPNELRASGRVSPWRLLLDQFKNVLIVILLAATALSFSLGHGVESIVIAVIVLFAVLLGFVQEFRAERAIEALREMAAPTATVLRDGREAELPTRTLVPGDIVVLHPGDRVPADGRVIESVNLMVEEAPLTGESLPVGKESERLIEADLPVGDRMNMVYAGTAVSYGRGRAVVVATGMRTEFGRIAQLLQSVKVGRTPLQKNLDRVGAALARAALVIVALVVVLGVVRGEPWLEMMLFGIALAVAVVPEALPAVVTISLAIGVQKMARRHALIRRLPAVETLGSTSVICSDKTGTLTRDEMTVRRIFVAGRTWEVEGSGYEPVGRFLVEGMDTKPSRELEQLLEAAILASDAQLRKRGDGWEVSGDPTEGALVVAAVKAGIDRQALEAVAPRTQEIPFTSETKRMTTLHKTAAAGTIAFTKGAPELIVSDCLEWVGDHGAVPLEDADRSELLGLARSFAEDALRVLAVSMKADAELGTAQRGMTLLGLVGMIDPPRPEAREAITVCERAGIRPVMITGDHPVTAEAVARELGLLRHGRVVVGADLDAMDDEQLNREVGEIDVYARVSPAHKLRVVTALQANQQVVAMTGDGVNDAPALKKADIGVAMGITGTDVTKEAADMTLTDDNFASIVAAVEEGRGVFDNIKKYLMYLLSSNIGEIGLMVGAVLAGLPLPLSAVQILYVNLATDGLPALALAVDPAEPGLMTRRPRSDRGGIFTRPVVTLMAAGGAWSTFINLGLFLWLLNSGRTLREAMGMVFVTLILIELLKAYNFRSDRHSVFVRPFANRWLNLAVLWEAALLTAIIYVPALQQALGTFPLSASDWLTVIALSLTVTPVLELVKWMVRKGWLATQRT